jgi:pimeloyl-ACP methyl ester carboxylesterase
MIDSRQEFAQCNRTLRLADGRLLGYAEYGNRDGAALFLFHGFPGSRLDIPAMWCDAPCNLRVIAPDRPGAGLSTFQRHRRLMDWVDDVRQLADSLGIDQFRVAGFSGGGPYALAVAHGLPARVLAAACISGVGPMDTPGALAGMNRTNRLLFRLATTAPLLLRLMVIPSAHTHKRRPARTYERSLAAKELPEADRTVMLGPRFTAISIAAMHEPFRQGVRGFVHEIRMYVDPWGFDVSAIDCPTFVWHGDQDVNVPVAMAQRLAARIPHCVLTICPGEAHLLLPRHWDEVVANLRVNS